MMMIKTTSKHAAQLTWILLRQTGMTEQFVSWKSWVSMVEGQKKNLVVQQENIQMNIKSFQDPGYSNDTKTVMGNSKAIAFLQAKIDTSNAKKPTAEQENLPPIKTWTVSEFIKRHYNDIEGNNKFENC
jgi:hypothetical protein